MQAKELGLRPGDSGEPQSALLRGGLLGHGRWAYRDPMTKQGKSTPQPLAHRPGSETSDSAVLGGRRDPDPGYPRAVY